MQPRFHRGHSLGETFHCLCELVNRHRDGMLSACRDARSLSPRRYHEPVPLQGVDCLLDGSRREVMHLSKTPHRLKALSFSKATVGDVGTQLVGESLMRGAEVGRRHATRVPRPKFCVEALDTGARSLLVSKHLTQLLDNQNVPGLQPPPGAAPHWRFC
jgi:hypothetical protein